jgi:hypothetical protein
LKKKNQKLGQASVVNLKIFFCLLDILNHCHCHCRCRSRRTIAHIASQRRGWVGRRSEGGKFETEKRAAVVNVLEKVTKWRSSKDFTKDEVNMLLDY